MWNNRRPLKSARERVPIEEDERIDRGSFTQKRIPQYSVTCRKSRPQSKKRKVNGESQQHPNITISDDVADDHNDGGIEDEEAVKNIYISFVNQNWSELLPKLVSAYLQHLGDQGKVPSAIPRGCKNCTCTGCNKLTTEYKCLDAECPILSTHHVKCYDLYGVVTRTFALCNCVKLPFALVSVGMFPTSPCKPRSAISLGLLNFMNVLRDNCAVSGENLASVYNALANFQDPRDMITASICRNVVQCYNKLLLLVEKQVRGE